MTVCNSCNSDNISLFTERSIFVYKGKNIDYDVEYSVCDNCNEEFIDKTQIHQNEIKSREAKKQIDGLLSALELREIRENMSLTQEVASQVFGGGQNAFSKYERSEVTQSVAMDRLIRVVEAVPEALHWLKKHVGAKILVDDYVSNSQELYAAKNIREGMVVNDDTYKSRPLGTVVNLQYGHKYG